MDQERFDRWSQSLATGKGSSRRRFLGTLGLVLAGALAGGTAEAVDANGRARHHQRPRRHHASSSSPGARGPRVTAALSQAQVFCTSPGTIGVTCRAATCLDTSTLQPACTCTGNAQCTCPAPMVCPTQTACEHGACVRTCQTDEDCNRNTGETCDKHGRYVPGSGPVDQCDCANLNACSGHGVCTDGCFCQCVAGWSGLTCSDQPVKGCSGFTTCGECLTHEIDGCSWCAGTIDGSGGGQVVCSTSDNCISQEFSCKA
jgi:hypothetical protein